ncbi:MAG: radical SAM protein [Desulfobacterium sp.]|nr:radical SAM protein [Desulfobacterium sp.]MBU3949364.1 radical SAM protein [Pseudomonadota bacterium]MBU4035089.1 radical SAM protein [Pseudomonadota bacterium]
MIIEEQQSPEYLKMSMAAALTLGFKNGRFFRNARLYCINLLQIYSGGCTANCAYCGLSRDRFNNFKENSFIRVDWPTYALDDIIEKMDVNKNMFKRICISMITNKRSPDDVLCIIEKIRAKLDTPISVLICPTIITEVDLAKFKESGADKIGVAIDAATPELFDKYRGKGVRGPHRWEKYWDTYQKVIEVFGGENSGVHLIVGLGETEKEMVDTIQRSSDMGGGTHLFSFYPEPASQMEQQQPPPVGQYRRIQLARYLIDENITSINNFDFDSLGKIKDFGLPEYELEKIINSGLPFMTSGCKGKDGMVACNRPYGNYPPPEIRNYPFHLTPDDVEIVKNQLWS